MKKKCPRCGTVVAVEPGQKPECPSCGYGTPSGEPTPVMAAAPARAPGQFDGAAMAAKIQEFNWRRLMFMGPVLNFVSEGRPFTRATAIAMRLAAVAVALGGIVASVFLWANGTTFFNTAADWIVGILVMLVLQVLVIASTYMVAHLLVIRARHVDALPEERFTIIPLWSLLLRVTGEIAAAVALPIGAAVGFFGAAASAGAAAGLGGALLGAVLAVPIGAVAILVFYFLAEATVVVVEIAKNTAAMRRASEAAAEAATEEAVA